MESLRALSRHVNFNGILVFNACVKDSETQASSTGKRSLLLFHAFAQVRAHVSWYIFRYVIPIQILSPFLMMKVRARCAWRVSANLILSIKRIRKDPRSGSAARFWTEGVVDRIRQIMSHRIQCHVCSNALRRTKIITIDVSVMSYSDVAHITFSLGIF